MKFQNFRSTLFGAALVCSSLVGCGDPSSNSMPDAGGPDAYVEPLKAGIAVLTDLERVVDVTSDGRTVLFWKQSNGELYFYDTASGQLDIKTSLTPQETPNEQPTGMSDVGQIVASYGGSPEAPARWDATNGWQKLKSPIGPCQLDPDDAKLTATGGAFGVSSNGKSVVGLLWDVTCRTQAFLWKDTGGDGTMIPLQKVGNGLAKDERASVVSADGKVAAGFAPQMQGDFGIDRVPAMWKDDGTGFLLDPNATDGTPGEVKAISADGKILVGDWTTLDPNLAALGQSTGFTWSEDTGVVRFSGPVPTNDHLIVNAASADGKLAYGKLTHVVDLDQGTFSPMEISAFVWSKAKGTRNLQEVATAAGITVPADLFLTNVFAVSADGRVVVGTAETPPDPNTGFGIEKLFVLVLPENTL